MVTVSLNRLKFWQVHNECNKWRYKIAAAPWRLQTNCIHIWKTFHHNKGCYFIATQSISIQIECKHLRALANSLIHYVNDNWWNGLQATIYDSLWYISNIYKYLFCTIYIRSLSAIFTHQRVEWWLLIIFFIGVKISKNFNCDKQI